MITSFHLLRSCLFERLFRLKGNTQWHLLFVFTLLFAVTSHAGLESDGVNAKVEPSPEPLGDWKVELSTFHQFRATWKDKHQSVRVSSKMDGAYDISIVIQLPEAKLTADIDLVHEAMVLDGGNAILTEDDKHILSEMNRYLIEHLLTEYEDSQPEHSLLAAQMLGYWSRAPMGYPIGYREVKAGS